MVAEQMQPKNENIKRAVRKLEQFKAGRTLWQIINSFISSQLLENEFSQSLNNVFNGIDFDCDGAISKNDLYKHFKKRMTKENAKKKVNSIFLNIDSEKCGLINFN